MFLKIVAGQQKWPGHFTRNEKTICTQVRQFARRIGVWPKLRSQLGFGHRDHQKWIPGEKLILQEAFVIENRATGARFGANTGFLSLWVRNFKFVTKLLLAWK